MFSDLALNVQLAALFESHVPAEMDGAGDLCVVEARLFDRALLVIGFDYSIRHGSMGTNEADQLINALRKAREDGLPVVFLLNTSGVRVTEGNAGIAALRRALRTALDACFDGIPMLALVGRHCFGGMSVLSTLCIRRVVTPNSLFAMSGPKLIERISGRADLVAEDKDAVRRLLAGDARSEASSGFVLTQDDTNSVRSALTDWLRTCEAKGADTGRFQSQMAMLRDRLRTAGRWPSSAESEPWLQRSLDQVVERLLGHRVQLLRTGDFVRADIGPDTSVRMFGLVDSAAADAVDVQRLAEAVAAVPATVKQVFVVLDCESHSARAADEKVVLSEYLGNLAVQVRARHRQGIDVQVVVTGESGGGIFAALAGSASSVTMLESARLRVLPIAAMAAINKSEDEQITAARALESGAADEVLGDTAGVCASGG